MATPTPGEQAFILPDKEWPESLSSFWRLCPLKQIFPFGLDSSKGLFYLTTLPPAELPKFSPISGRHTLAP